MERQLVVFTLAHEHYGVDIAAVESIIKLQPITVVPRAPAFIEGVTNLRGSVLPVMDLRKRFGLGSTAETAEKEQKDRRIVVVALEGVKVGMIVDAVTEVLRVADEAIEPPPPMVTSVDTAFITAIAKVGAAEQDAPGQAARLIILLDLERVLSLDERSELKAVPLAA